MNRCLLALAFTFAISAAQARTLDVGAGREFSAPSAAFAAAHDGDRIQIQPGEYFDCGSIGANNVTVEGVGDPTKVLMTDKACGGKALIIITGSNATIRNLTLTRVRVPDGNGAGIRMESKDLTIERVYFVNNQEGILAGIGRGTVRITDSVFDRDGACDQACAHGVYLNNVDLLQVQRSRFVNTQHGHGIKSRALRTEVSDCVFEDGPTGTGSYMVEAPNGGSLVVRNSTMTKGPKAENHSVISIGGEGITQPTKEITIEGNTLRNTGDYQAIFVDNHSATEAMLRGNTLTGSITPLKGDGQVIAGK